MSVELVARSPAGESHTQLLQLGERLILGRGKAAGLRLRDLEASREHVAIELTPSGVLVTDLGSGNGTLLDGARLPANVPQSVELPFQLQVGTHTVLLRVPGSAATQPLAERRLRDEYEHKATLGSGAHGTVSVAIHRATGRRVAIKAFRAGGVSATVRERFLREGRIRIDCPQIAQVYDVREESGNLFIIMELVPGRSAHELIAAGPLPIPQALRIATDVARGLAVAHQHGVIHRDIKPTNIMITPEGNAKIVDFGIAKMKGEVLTNTGQGIGTLSYIAPEQAADAKRTSPSADLYSLGATLYHMITGKTPFDPASPEFFENLMEDPPPRVLRFRPDCPRAVAKLVEKLLEKDPLDRVRDAETLAAQLRAL